jgi:NADH:ubiquinone oxidoreductase subunit 2 (subunit N)
MMHGEQLPDWAALAPALSLVAAAFVLFALDLIDPDSENRIMLVVVAATGAITSLAFTVWYLLAGTGAEEGVELFNANLVVDGLGLFFAAIIGSVVLTQLWSATAARSSLPPEERPPYHVIVDEIQEFVSEADHIRRMLSQCREFNVSC